MPIQTFTAADFARLCGHTVTAAMKLDVLTESVAVVAPVAIVAPEVQAVIDARTEVAKFAALPRPALQISPSLAEMRERDNADRERFAALRRQYKAERVCYVPSFSVEDSYRAISLRIVALENEQGPTEALLATAKKRGAVDAIARHEVTLAGFAALLAPLYREANRLASLIED